MFIGKSEWVLDCVVDELDGFVFGEGFEPKERGAGDQRRVDSEEWVFSGCADEGDQSAFDIGQEDILLGFGEPVDLVEEEDGAFARIAQDAVGIVDDLADALDADRCGVLADKPSAGCFGDDLGECGFAGAGRAVEDDGGEGVGVDHSAEEFVRGQEVGLPDNLGDRGGADARCQGRDRFDSGFSVGLPKIGHTGSVWVREPVPIGLGEKCWNFGYSRMSCGTLALQMLTLNAWV